MTVDREQIAAEEAEWIRTGRIRCSDCGTMVTTHTLETLPDHRCAQRQAQRRAAAEFIERMARRDPTELEQLRAEAWGESASCPVCDGTEDCHQIGCQPKETQL